MRNKVIKQLFKKELLDVVRDRKAMIMLVLVPLLIYPLIFFGSFAVMSMIQSNMEQRVYKVLVDTDDDGAFAAELDEYNIKQMESAKTEKSSDTDAASSKAVDMLKIVELDQTELTDEDVRKALIDYINNLDYNSYVYFQSVIDAIQAVSHIKFVDGSSTLHIRKYNSNTREYGDQIQISDISQLYAGYATFIDENGISTLIMENCANKVEALASTANIKFVPQSSL